jgi:hypothetical protein
MFWIHFETADSSRFCPVCGMVGVVKEHPKVWYADVPVFGQQAALVWHKYRWERTGENRTWTEERPDIAARSLSALTHRAGVGHGTGWSSCSTGLAGRCRGWGVVEHNHDRREERTGFTSWTD